MTFLTLGVSSSLGNSFVHPNTRNHVGIKRGNESSLLSTDFNIFVPMAVRGGASSSLSATSVDGTSVEQYSVVAKYISQENWELLSARGRVALSKLIASDDGINAQKHVYADWPEKGTEDDDKVKLVEQVSTRFDPGRIGNDGGRIQT